MEDKGDRQNTANNTGGHPPWEPGQSGNPGGRPKETGILTKILIKDIQKPASTLLTPEEMEELNLPEDATLADAYSLAAIKAGILKPSSRAASRVIERIDGKVPERLDVDANVGGALGNYTLDLSKLDAEEIMRILELQRKCQVEEQPET